MVNDMAELNEKLHFFVGYRFEIITDRLAVRSIVLRGKEGERLSKTKKNY